MIKRFFVKHLRDAEETYWQHLRFGIWAGIVLGTIAVISIVHAIFPFILPRVPDKIYQYFNKSAMPRLARVRQLFQNKQ